MSIKIRIQQTECIHSSWKKQELLGFKDLVMDFELHVNDENAANLQFTSDIEKRQFSHPYLF